MDILVNDDCLSYLPTIKDKSIDMILADLPYGTTKNYWDIQIDLDKLWVQLNRVIKDNGAIVLFAQSPYDKVLAVSNIKDFRYEWIWEKTSATGHLNAKKMPMKAHENVLVFYKKLPTYNPQKTKNHKPVNSYTKHSDDGNNYGKTKVGISGGGSTERYPRSVQVFKSDKQTSKLHPTQKPVDLCEYLIRTYTNENEIVLDFASGSATTAIACINSNRRYICIEKYHDIFEVGRKRVNSYKKGVVN